MKHIDLVLVRHGDSDYIEHDAEDRTIDLNNNGIKQITEFSEAILPSLNPNVPLVFYSSPAWRAQDSEEIIYQMSVDRGYLSLRRRPCSTLRPILINDSRNSEYQFQLARERAKRFILHLSYLFWKSNYDVLQIVSVSHYEILHPIAEYFFDESVFMGKGFQKGEALQIEFTSTNSETENLVKIRFRNQKIEHYHYDNKNNLFLPFSRI